MKISSSSHVGGRKKIGRCERDDEKEVYVDAVECLLDRDVFDKEKEVTEDSSSSSSSS